jgi:hypothetical protein
MMWKHTAQTGARRYKFRPVDLGKVISEMRDVNGGPENDNASLELADGRLDRFPERLGDRRDDGLRP